MPIIVCILLFTIAMIAIIITKKFVEMENIINDMLKG